MEEPLACKRLLFFSSEPEQQLGSVDFKQGGVGGRLKLDGAGGGHIDGDKDEWMAALMMIGFLRIVIIWHEVAKVKMWEAERAVEEQELVMLGKDHCLHHC